MKENINVINKSIILALSIIVLGIGVSLSLKAAIGVGAWDALAQSISGISNIKVGTVSMMLNISCVFIQLILLKKDFALKQVLQIFVAILLGIVVNFIFYNVISGIEINSYIINIVLLIFSYSVCAFAVSVIMAINFIGLPLESCCIVIGKKINKKFGTLRQFVDILSIILVIIFAIVLKEKLTVREGTIIGMIMFGPMINYFTSKIKPRIENIKVTM